MKENLQAARALEEGPAGGKARAARDAAGWAAIASARNAATKNRMNAAFPALSDRARNAEP